MLFNCALAQAAPILVVEDSDEDFDTFLEAVRMAGVSRTVFRAVSGGACLEMLTGQQEFRPKLLPALIMMDLNSYGVDGREALIAIKNDCEKKQIPLVVLTTSANAKDVTFCYQAGANAYHVKPLRHDQYLILLCSILRYWLDTATLHMSDPKG
jgi:CheY-like chemotaxis protein